MSSIVNVPGGGISQAQLDAAILAHLQTAPHFTQAQIQSLINSSVTNAIAGLVLPTYGLNFQGTRVDVDLVVSSAGSPAIVLDHTVINVNNGEHHSILVTGLGSALDTASDNMIEVLLNGNVIDNPVLTEYKDPSANQEIPFILHLNEVLENGDLLQVRADKSADLVFEIKDLKLVLWESQQLNVQAAPAQVSVSSPSSLAQFAFWNQMAGDTEGVATINIVPVVSGGVGPFTYSWALSGGGGTGSPAPVIQGSDTNLSVNVQAVTSNITYIRDIDATLTVTDTGTGLTAQTTTNCNFNISETSN